MWPTRVMESLLARKGRTQGQRSPQAGMISKRLQVVYSECRRGVLCSREWSSGDVSRFCAPVHAVRRHLLVRLACGKSVEGVTSANRPAFISNDPFQRFQQQPARSCCVATSPGDVAPITLASACPCPAPLHPRRATRLAIPGT